MSVARTPINRTYKNAWLHRFVATDGDLPELPTNEHWRELMKRARLQPRPPDYPKGITQQQLADMVGTSQVMISLIESGEVSSSKFIKPICQALGNIPPPEHFADELNRRWAKFGQMLRSRGLEKQEAAIRAVIALGGFTDEDLKEWGLLEDDEAKKTK